MRAIVLASVSSLVGCSEPPQPSPCALAATGGQGSVEVGVGRPFTPIVEDGELFVELGLQGLYMFVTNARVRDMQISHEGVGAIDFVARDPDSSEVLSLEVGCRDREFALDASGAQLASPYFLALRPELSATLDGMRIAIEVRVRDLQGKEATDVRTVVARKP